MQVATHILNLEAAAEPFSFEACYAAHHRKVLHLGMRYGAGNAAWAEDLAHDVFVRLAEKIDELHNLEDVGGWLYRVASNLAISRLRRERSFLGRVATTLRADGNACDPGAESVVVERQLGEKAMAALRKLPPKEQVVLSMKILDDKSQKEIAEALSMSQGYVSKLVARALGRIEKEGWEVSSC
jgi:RNA polymerase sigma-70 factor (ECF subfamily)